MNKFSEKDIDNEISSIRSACGEYLEMMTEGQKMAFVLKHMTLKMLIERDMKDFYKKINYARSSVRVNS
jgi:hypothetical protein